MGVRFATEFGRGTQTFRPQRSPAERDPPGFEREPSGPGGGQEENRNPDRILNTLVKRN